LSRDATPVAQAPAADKTTSAPPERRRLAQAPARRKPVRPVRFVERAPIPVAQPFFWWFR
jgi:hypothetical protein